MSNGNDVFAFVFRNRLTSASTARLQPVTEEFGRFPRLLQGPTAKLTDQLTVNRRVKDDGSESGKHALEHHTPLHEDPAKQVRPAFLQSET